MKFLKPFLGMVLSSVMALSAHAQQAPITLHGASQFGDDHAFTKTMVRFEELVKKYYGKPVNFVLHKNSELGLEKDYFAYMNQGKAVDYAIVSPAHMSTFSKAAPFIDAPFLFSDLNHWTKVLDQDLLKPIADEVEQKADHVSGHPARLRRVRGPEGGARRRAARDGRALQNVYGGSRGRGFHRALCVPSCVAGGGPTRPLRAARRLRGARRVPPPGPHRARGRPRVPALLYEHGPGTSGRREGCTSRP